MKRGLLLSGGIDSTALIWWKRPAIAYTIDYGQLAADEEIKAAKAICEILRCVHCVTRINLASLGCGFLAGRKPSSLSQNKEWWPFRNQLLLTVAGMHAVQHGIKQLIIGTVRSDSRHADGKPIFVRRIRQVMSQQEGGLEVVAPAITLDTVQLVIRSKLPLALVLQTHSCHQGNTHCCQCPGCVKRLKVFEQLGLA